MILGEVKRLSSLVQDLAKNVDAVIVAASETLPPPKGFITAEQRDVDIGNLDTIMTDEKGVTNFYNTTTARYCSHLVSTRALHFKASHNGAVFCSGSNQVLGQVMQLWTGCFAS